MPTARGRPDRGFGVEVRSSAVELTPEGAHFSDGTAGRYDDVILATGFGAALGPLGSLIQLDPQVASVRPYHTVKKLQVSTFAS